MDRKQSRYDIFDLTKLILSVLVVFIHCEPLKQYSDFGNIITKGGICRIAVPLFFAMSGLFLLKEGLSSNRFLRQLKKLLKLYLTWSAIYFLMKIYFASRLGSLSIGFLKEELWNTVFIAEHYHMWYVLALIYAIFILLLCSKIHLKRLNTKGNIIVIGLLYLIGCLHYTYNWICGFANCNIDMVIYKFEGLFNAVFIALPLMLVGVMAYRNYARYSKRGCLIKCFVALVMYFAEIMMLFIFVRNVQYYVHYLTTPILIYYLICLLLKIDFSFSNPSLSMFCRQTSLFIYCIHPMLIYLWQIYVGSVGFLRFCIVLIGSIVLSIVYYFVFYTIKRRKKI